ncbi:MAG: V-type ATP synthase subunit A [Anaerolineaceae bacterium]|nr:V-type ATP synthase subunit A [Anaerolineaceae bacterium]
MTSTALTHGEIIRVSGPIITARNMRAVTMYEVVEVSELHLIGEVVRIVGDTATIQVYENTSMVRPGDAVFRTGGPLSVKLGPGLIGNIYDGIQRPLKDLEAHSGAFIQRGEKAAPLDLRRRWHFVPTASQGDSVGPGAVIGTVRETEAVQLRVMAPPTVQAPARIQSIVEEGDYTIDQPLAVVRQDGGTDLPVAMAQSWPVREARPVTRRRPADRPLVTGQRIIDTLFPIAAIPGGFGTGKTMTQHALAKWSDADIIVYIGCGERGNEMTDVLTEFPELVDPRSGRPLMERTILIANTSNMPVAAREVSIYTGITLAEFYRDMGYHVAVFADSTSRWAEALRELSARLEEIPAEEGFPASLPSRLAQFYERAGMVEPLSGGTGSVSVVGAVSPPGGDFAEPVTQHTRRFVRCFWALDRQLADARHYPAINWLTSYSMYLEDVEPWWKGIDPDWAGLRNQAINLLQQEDKLQQIVKLVGPDVLPDSQRLILTVCEIIKTGLLQQNAFDPVDMYSTPAKQISLLRAMLRFFERGRDFIAGGGTLAEVQGLAIIQELVRAKSTIKNEDEAGLKLLATRVEKQFDEIERK